MLARREAGYHRLAAAITAAQLAGGEKGRPVYSLEALAEQSGGEWVVPTGCRKGAVRRALAEGGADAAARELDRLVALFGRDNVVVELFDHGHPLDQEANDALAGLAERAGPAAARDERGALRDARPSIGSRPRSRRCGRGAASTSSTVASQASRMARTPAAGPSGWAMMPPPAVTIRSGERRPGVGGRRLPRRLPRGEHRHHRARLSVEHRREAGARRCDHALVRLRRTCSAAR